MLEPNSTVVVWSLWAVALLGIVGVCVIWPRFANRTGPAVLGRFLTQTVASALVVLAVAGALNQQNGWYGSWTDLGNDILGNPPTVAHEALRGQLQYTGHYNSQAARSTDIRAQREFGAERASFQRSLHLRTKPSPEGQYTSVVVPGLGPSAPKGAGKVLVWLPSSYAHSSQQTTYPVIEAYAGIPGSPRDYQTKVGLHKIITVAHQRYGLVEPIVVIPDYNPAGLDTECVDSPGVPMETWVTKTIPTWVVKHLRARPDRGSWAAMGYSAGAFCAEVSVVLHPKQYGALMIFGGYNSPEWGNWLPFGRRSAWPARYNILNELRSSPPPIDVWIEQSEADLQSIGPARRLINAVRAPTSITTVTLKGAGHRFDVWQGVMPNALRWLANSEPGFRRPVSGPDVHHAREHPQRTPTVVPQTHRREPRHGQPSPTPRHPSSTAPPSAPPSPV